LQRLFDILLSSIALIVLSPIMLPIIVLLRCTGEGEVFYFQGRVGKDQKLFKLFKFATMLKNSENLGTGTLTLKDDPRILPIGNILRKTKVNELPQLINIFRGEMSIIGPRPQTKRCFDAFPEHSQKAIIRIRPGLSGIGSIIFRDEHLMTNGKADPAIFYDQIIMPYKGSLEEWYIRNNTIFNYILLIILTLWTVFSSSSKLVWFFFSNLPEVPNELSEWISK
jgi:lipopolysaccharide/colanic/teichoic acid biosynthesis glycosyltransferase